MATIINCVQCNSEFYGNANAMYCSGACKQKGYRNKIDKGRLYLLYLDGDVVYVGKSSSYDGAERRVSQHRIGTRYEEPKNFDSYEISHEISSLSEMECEYIAKLKPRLNRSFPTNSSYIIRKKLIEMMMPVINEYIDNEIEMIKVDERYGGHIRIEKAALEVEIFKGKLMPKGKTTKN